MPYDWVQMETDTMERVQRAREQDLTVSVVAEEPVVLQVDNNDSDRVHTLVPAAGHCSCEDHTYRHTVCKHMLYVLSDSAGESDDSCTPEEDSELDNESRASDLLEAGLRSQRNSVESQADDIRRQISELEEERDTLLNTYQRITDAFSALGIDQVDPETDREGMDLLRAGVESGDFIDDEVLEDIDTAPIDRLKQLHDDAESDDVDEFADGQASAISQQSGDVDEFESMVSDLTRGDAE